jgi:hypothetical protein
MTRAIAALALMEKAPAIDRVECVLTALFLRRYITYCARRRRYDEMQGAARLYRGIMAVQLRSS